MKDCYHFKRIEDLIINIYILYQTPKFYLLIQKPYIQAKLFMFGEHKYLIYYQNNLSKISLNIYSTENI